MNNTQRREALAEARAHALEHARNAEGGKGTAGPRWQTAIELASMWANVANAMKVGQALEADGVVEMPLEARPTPGFSTITER